MTMETFGTATAYHAPIESLSCPHCGQRETVERVASLVAGGVTPIVSTIGRMPMVLGTGRAYGMTPRNTAGVGVSGVPDYLLPPKEPEGLRYRVSRHIVAMVVLGLIGLVVFAIGSVPVVTRNTIGGAIPTVPFTAIGATLLIGALAYIAWGIAQLASGRARRQIREEMARYTRAMERWNRLYYCTDCHCVFTPGMTACIPHRQVRASLFS
jgi:hypothetical protein